MFFILTGHYYYIQKIMDQPNNLGLEQQFKLTVVRNKLVKLSTHDSRSYLHLTLQYMLIKDNIIKFLVKRQRII